MRYDAIPTIRRDADAFLVAALRRADPDLPAWNWAPQTPQVAGALVERLRP